MKIKINTEISLSTGEVITGAIIQLFNENFALNQAQFVFDLKVWRSEADQIAEKDHSYLFGTSRITNGMYIIPEEDMDQANIDGHFGVIGTNHPIRLKDALASMLGINSNTIQILALV